MNLSTTGQVESAADAWDSGKPQPPSTPRPARKLDRPDQQGLDNWLRASIVKYLEEFAEIVGEEAARDNRELREEIAVLRADIEILQGIVKSNNGATVIKLKGSASDAA